MTLTNSYFSRADELTKLVVPPAYWRRGHGTASIPWGKRPADMDYIPQVMLPSKIGGEIAFVEGFEHIAEVHVDGDRVNPEEIDMGVGVYMPRKRVW